MKSTSSVRAEDYLSMTYMATTSVFATGKALCLACLTASLSSAGAADDADLYMQVIMNSITTWSIL